MKMTVQKNTRNPGKQDGNPAVVQQNASVVTPEVNIFETAEGYVLEAEMPGVNKEGLEITLEGNELTIYGRKNFEPLPGERVFGECTPSDYRRVFELDPAIDGTRIAAKMEQGILILTLPKSEAVKPRRIRVE